MADDVLILIDQQKAKEHPKWGPRNNPEAERNIARLLAAWRARDRPIIHVRHDSTYPDSPFRPGQDGNDFSPLTAPLAGEAVLAKRVTSAFIGTQALAGRGCASTHAGAAQWRLCDSDDNGCGPRGALGSVLVSSRAERGIFCGA